MADARRSRELETAVEAARKAGRILMENYGRITVSYKKDLTIVTNADLESERYILSTLRREFPDHSILSEEAGLGEGDSEYMWAVDPLDGTTNYSMRNPFFNVSIALTYRKEPVVGVVYYPFQDELFHAEKGGGAYLNDERIKVSKIDSMMESIHTFCHASDRDSTLKMAGIWRRLKLLNPKVRQIGAGALELSYTACGRVDSFMMVNMNPWDVAAGALLVREAGGKVSDFTGREFDVDCRDILASNGRLHERLLEIINEDG
jgi:myo-inositol-1(or 4)-monophosphatase